MENKVLEEFLHPYNAGRLKNPDFVGQATNNDTADIVVFAVKLENDNIAKIKFQVFGGKYVVAVCSYICRLLENKNINTIPTLEYNEINSQLELTEDQNYIFEMAKDALNNLLNKYLKKKKKLSKNIEN